MEILGTQLCARYRIDERRKLCHSMGQEGKFSTAMNVMCAPHVSSPHACTETLPHNYRTILHQPTFRVSTLITPYLCNQKYLSHPYQQANNLPSFHTGTWKIILSKPCLLLDLSWYRLAIVFITRRCGDVVFVYLMVGSHVPSIFSNWGDLNVHRLVQRKSCGWRILILYLQLTSSTKMSHSPYSDPPPESADLISEINEQCIKMINWLETLQSHLIVCILLKLSQIIPRRLSMLNRNSR